MGGAEKVLASLCLGAQSRGWQAVVVNPFGAAPGAGGFRSLLGPVPYMEKTTTSSRQLAAARSWTASTLAALEPDVVHVHLYHAAVLAATLPRPLPGRSWVLTHHYGPLFGLEKRRVRALADRWATHRATGPVVAVSGSVRQYVIEGCHVGPGRVPLIYNGWAGTPLPLANDGSPPTVVCVANFRPQKGHEVLLRAFAAVARRVPGARLVLAGAGPLEAAVRSQVGQLGLTGSVEFAGVVEDIWPLLASAHVFALSSWYEPLGIAVLEAMAAGLPVVATATGGVRELVEDGTSGWLVPPGDQEALADRLARALENSAVARQFGLAGTAAVAAKTEEAMVDSYYNLYEGL